MEIKKYRARDKETRKFIEGYYWKSPLGEFNEEFIIETYIKYPATGKCNARFGTRSRAIIPTTLTEVKKINNQQTKHPQLNDKPRKSGD